MALLHNSVHRARRTGETGRVYIHIENHQLELSVYLCGVDVHVFSHVLMCEDQRLMLGVFLHHSPP